MKRRDARPCRSVLGLALVCVGCCADPWQEFPQAVQPDTQCSTGSVHGHDVYIWECLEGMRVVVAQYSAEWSCHAPLRATAACGELTDFEMDLESKGQPLTEQMCQGPRPGRQWR